MPSAALSPDAILASTNLGASPSLAAIQDDPDAADSTWLSAVDDSLATDIRVSFPSPSGTLTAGADLQSFKMWLRKGAAVSGSPTVDVQLYENGSLKATLATGTAITSATGQLVTATWNASSLTSLSGADVELRIVSTPVSDSIMPSYRAVGTQPVGASTINPSIPSPTVAGELLILHASARANNINGINDIANWTGLTISTQDANSNNLRQRLFWKIADGTETGTVNVVRSGGTSSSNGSRIYAISNVDTSGGASMFEGSNLSTGSGLSIGMPSVTTSGANRRVFAFTATADNNALGDPTGETGGDYTEVLAEIIDNGNAGLAATLTSAPMASAGTISGGTMSQATSVNWLTRAFALKPVSASASVDVGAVEWNVAYDDAAASKRPSFMMRGGANPHFIGMV